MKNNLFTLPGLVILITILLFSCQKKKETGIAPSYKEEQGTGGNPFPNNPTVTGTSTITNPATQNSSLLVGGTGWSNPTCASTFSTTLKGVNGNVNVTLSFFGPPVSGTYNISAAPSQSQTCSMMVINAPNQPAGIVWTGLSGQVVVNTTSTSINASFNGIVCAQSTFNFPTVTVTGALGCN